jgi:hypothetical protein
MSKKRYQIKTSCPQCGCSGATALSKEELMERYGDVPNIDMECGECMIHYSTPMKDACPEWDDECRMRETGGK